MAIPGLYRRVLPSPPAFEFSSSQGKEFFKEALGNGNMEGFFKLISYYQTQSEPAYCGLASLAMVLNALAIDPGRKWKGPWRWFDDSMLDCCEPLSKIMEEGISFGKVACLAHCNGAKVEAFRTDKSTVDDFRKHVISCTSSEDCHVITSYNRAVFKQTGTGHFSPIGGYHTGKDLVLILDVARFKYPPHWVPLTLLWEAMDTIDQATGQYRGFMIISTLQNAPSILYTVSCRHESWNSIAKYLVNDVPYLLKSEDVNDIQEVLSLVFKSPSIHLMEFIKWIAEVRRHENGTTVLSEEEARRLAIKEEALKQVQETELYSQVATWLSSDCSFCKCNPDFSDNDTIPEFAAGVCCQGAQLLTGKPVSSAISCCNNTDIKLTKIKSENPVTVVSGTVTNDGNQQGVEVLIPSSQAKPSNFCGVNPGHCWGMYPSTSDVFTVLLLALPQNTWSGIKVAELRMEIYRLMLTDNLPELLQQEVLHLQMQLHFLVTECGAPGAAL